MYDSAGVKKPIAGIDGLIDDCCDGMEVARAAAAAAAATDGGDGTGIELKDEAVDRPTGMLGMASKAFPFGGDSAEFQVLCDEVAVLLDEFEKRDDHGP